MNVLLIVDPQIDFISGTLPVPGASEAMDRLAQWIDQHADTYDAVVVTMDQHPLGHCSFAEQGGPWPPHCVRYSLGAAIYPPILEAIGAQAHTRALPLLFVEKATSVEQDAYSAFASEVPQILQDALHIYLAGLAGDFCVAATQADLERSIPSERITRLEPCIAYIQRPA